MDYEHENEKELRRQKREKCVILVSVAVTVAVVLQMMYKKLLITKHQHPYRGRSLLSAITRSFKMKKKKKRAVMKIASALESVAKSFDELVNASSLAYFSKQLTAAVNGIPGLDCRRRLNAKRFLIKKKHLAAIFLATRDEDKKKVLDKYVPVMEILA